MAHRWILVLILVLLKESWNKTTHTLVGDMVLVRDQNNMNFLSPISQQQQLEKASLAVKVLQKQCLQAHYSHLFTYVKGFGQLEIACLQRYAKQSATIIKSDIEEYRWVRKNIYYKGLQNRVKLVWSKVGVETGLFKNSQIYTKYGSLELQPSIILSSFAANVLQGPYLFVLQISSLDEMKTIFQQWNAYKVEKSMRFLIILEFDLEISEVTEQIQNLIKRSDIQQWRQVQGEVFSNKIQKQHIKMLNKGIYSIICT